MSNQSKNWTYLSRTLKVLSKSKWILKWDRSSLAFVWNAYIHFDENPVNKEESRLQKFISNEYFKICILL